MSAVQTRAKKTPNRVRSLAHFARKRSLRHSQTVWVQVKEQRSVVFDARYYANKEPIERIALKIIPLYRSRSDQKIK